MMKINSSKPLIAVLGALIVMGSLGAADLPAQVINGAGATFPYPVYSQWAYKYHQITGVKLNYQSIGSGGGIRQIKAKTVDFGASDAPLKPGELEASGLIQFPLILGGVVPVVHLQGVAAGELKLDAELLSDLFLGKITRWNDPAIQALNPDVKLPNKEITVVHRSDGSGTTWIFTHYLAAVSPEWEQKVGAGKAVSWPVGIGGKGNEGVSSYVQRVDGGIGYVEFAYALQNNLTYVLLKNRAGKFVAPTKDNFMAAAANADWKNAPGFYLVLVDQPGENSWPITGASFIILHKEQKDEKTARTMLEFFDWCYKHGGEIALQLDYVPIPDNVVEIVENLWMTDLRANGKAVWK
jgi:phosphate transport system substrate-binding protein